MIATLLRVFEIRSIFSIYSFCYLFIFSAFIGHFSLALAENPGPQGNLGFLDFPPITEIDGVNFGPTNVTLSILKNIKLFFLIVSFLLLHYSIKIHIFLAFLNI